MHDQPDPSEAEHEAAQDEQDEHEAMRGAGHDDPPDVEDVEGEQ
jgi:hypothetical protein